MKTGLLWLGLVVIGLSAGCGDKKKERGVAFAAAKIDMLKAVEVAEAESNGLAFEVELEMEGGQPVYDVECLVGDSVTGVMVNGLTGEVLSTETKNPSPDEWETLALFRKVSDENRRNLIPAIEKAIEKEGGLAVEVDLEVDLQDPHFVIEVMNDGRKKEVWVEVDRG